MKQGHSTQTGTYIYTEAHSYSKRVSISMQDGDPNVFRLCVIDLKTGRSAENSWSVDELELLYFAIKQMAREKKWEEYQALREKP